MGKAHANIADRRFHQAQSGAWDGQADRHLGANRFERHLFSQRIHHKTHPFVAAIKAHGRSGQTSADAEYGLIVHDVTSGYLLWADENSIAKT
ncbi:hypothetical protein D3C71_2062590 [compost metagenome]